jgi:CBS domain-containing protein
MKRTVSTAVRDVARRDVVTVAREATLAACAKAMRERHVGSLVVIDAAAGSMPVGIVTDRDIVLEAIAPGLDAAVITAGDVMATPLATVREDDDVLDVLARMREQGARRLPVCDRDGRLTGIVAFDDVVAMIGELLQAAVSVLDAERTREESTRAGAVRWTRTACTARAARTEARVRCASTRRSSSPRWRRTSCSCRSATPRSRPWRCGRSGAGSCRRSAATWASRSGSS